MRFIFNMSFYTLLFAALILPGCGGNGETGNDLLTDSREDNERTTSAEDMDGGASPPLAPADGPPAPELAPVYSAKITKVDVSAGSKERYNVEIIFTTAQGRSFTANVFSDDGALIYEESIDDVPDAYYAHVFAFEYRGSLESLNVEVISPDEKTVLDKWDL